MEDEYKEKNQHLLNLVTGNKQQLESSSENKENVDN